MNKVLLALLVLVVACTPIQPTVNDNTMTPPAQTGVSTSEAVTSPAQPPAEEAMEDDSAMPMEVTGEEIDPYSTLGCEKILTAEEFATACGISADSITVTSKLGTRNCMINVLDKKDPRLTAGVSLTGYADDETAEKEFDRRLVVLKVGADTSVGERAYVKPNPPIDRAMMYFLKNEFLVEAGADNRVCPADKVVEFAKVVASKLS